MRFLQLILCFWICPSVSQFIVYGNLSRICILLLCAAAATKSLQSCPTLFDPRDGSPPGSPVPGILQARTLEWVAISFSNAWKGKWNCSVVSDSFTSDSSCVNLNYIDAGLPHSFSNTRTGTQELLPLSTGLLPDLVHSHPLGTSKAAAQWFYESVKTIYFPLKITEKINDWRRYPNVYKCAKTMLSAHKLQKRTGEEGSCLRGSDRPIPCALDGTSSIGTC